MLLCPFRGLWLVLCSEVHDQSDRSRRCLKEPFSSAQCKFLGPFPEVTFQNNCPRKLHTARLSAELPHIGVNSQFLLSVYNDAGGPHKAPGLEWEDSRLNFQLQKFLVSTDLRCWNFSWNDSFTRNSFNTHLMSTFHVPGLVGAGAGVIRQTPGIDLRQIIF